MKIKLEGWLYMKPDEYSPANPKISFWDGKETNYWVTQGYIPLCEHTIEVETPEVDVIAGQVNSLIAKKEKLTAEFSKTVAKIDDALAQLKCLTFDPSGVAV